MRDFGKVLTSGEVGKLFGVTGPTVARWAKEGKIKAFQTIGGHLRFHMADVLEALEEMQAQSRDGTYDG